MDKSVSMSVQSYDSVKAAVIFDNKVVVQW